MVALFHGFTHDASAHTSYLLLVKDLFRLSMAFRTSAQHKNPAASPFGATAWLRPFFRISLQCRSGLTIIIADAFLRQQFFKKFSRFRVNPGQAKAHYRAQNPRVNHQQQNKWI
jgi:hypothetical protein